MAPRFAARIAARIHSQKSPYFHNVRVIRANRLKSAIHNCLLPRKRNSRKRGSVREPRDDSRESGDLRESENRFTQIVPSKARKRKVCSYHSPRNVYKLIPPPGFFLYFFCIFYGNSLRPPIFSVTLMRSSGSRVDWKIFL